MNRLQQRYQDEIKLKLKKEFNIVNEMEIPKLKKIVVNMGIGDISKDKQSKAKVEDYLTQICGQKVQARPAKKSIAEFSIREGDTIGYRATLRGSRAYDFIDKLCSVILPRVRDFQGISSKSFDESGNYNFGLREQIIFPEIVYDKIDKIRGLQITINTSAKTKQEAYRLLQEMGMPFEKEEKK